MHTREQENILLPWKMSSWLIEQEQVDLHAYIYVRFDGEMETSEPDTEPLEVTENE